MKFLKSLPKDKLQKVILVVIVSVVAVGCVYNFYVSKQLTELGAKKAVIAKLMTQLTEAQKAVKEEVNNTALRDQVTAFITGQERRMLEGDQLSWVVREMSLLAERHPVQVTSINPGGLIAYTAKPQYEMYTAKLEINGTYDQLGKFVSDWENSFPTSFIRSLSMVVVDAGKARCRINVDAVMLIRPNAKPAANKTETKKSMRTLTEMYGVAGTAAGAHQDALIELQDLSHAVGDPAQAELEYVARRSPVNGAVRIVGLLAFGQSLVFLVIWLLICASAGAATVPKKAEFNPSIQSSNYEPTKTRDPFTKAGSSVAGEAKSAPITPASFQLQGILYQPSNPSAIVNGYLLTLNKTVTIDPDGANIPVKAVSITRQSLVMEVNGQKVELRLEDTKAAPAP